MTPRPQCNSNNVSMPADILATIIRTIGNANQSSPAPRSQVVNRYVPRRPAPPPNQNRGRGGFGGRGRGQSNRRGKRGSTTTRDPRRQQTAEPSPIPIPQPTASTSQITVEAAVQEPVITPSEPDDFSFLNEYANVEIGSGNEADVMMTDNSIANVADYVV
jgi:hypothetical protein